VSLPSAVPGVLGETSLDDFDVVIIGSGPGGCAAAHILTQANLSVLVLEAGNNYFLGLDDPAPGKPTPLFGSDELKQSARFFGKQDPLIEPRTYRENAAVPGLANGDVNTLGRTVGGAWIHADVKVPRFNEVDFRMASALHDAGRVYDGANFADWPLTYAELEPWYSMAEQLSGVSGTTTGEGADPFASPRSGPYPMPPNNRMYADLVLSEGSRLAGYHPIVYPAAVNSRPYDGRPACVSCGLCSGYGCPNNSKGSGAVTMLRKALLTGRCQVRYNCFVTRLVHSGRTVTGVEYIDDRSDRLTVGGDRFILAASPIEDARLCFLSDPGGAGLGNSSGLVGRNLMFHLQTIAVGIFKQRMHGERGQSVTGGMVDFRGVEPGGMALAKDGRPLGGIIEFGTNSEAIDEAKQYGRQEITSIAGQLGLGLKQLMLDSPLRDHLAVMIMQAEDAPQLGNRVDLDPSVTDVYGVPVPRVTHVSHAFELQASQYYQPRMVEVIGKAGAQFGFVNPDLDKLGTRHVMGTLRMGTDPSASVCNAAGKFHDLDNLYCGDGAVFPTASGYNPTLTIIALALRMADAIGG